MAPAPQAFRLLVRHAWLQAAALGITATLLVWGLWTFAPVTLTSLEWSLYDSWMLHRSPSNLDPSLVVVTRDPVSEQLLGSGQWDRSTIARMVTALHQAGAAVIGIDLSPAIPSPPSQGGALADAMLFEATKEAGPVVFTTPLHPAIDGTLTRPELPAEHQTILVGHLVPALDADRVVRRAPFRLMTPEESVPSLAFALATLLWQTGLDSTSSPPESLAVPEAVSVTGASGAMPIPTDSREQLTINYANDKASENQDISFAELWGVIDRGDIEPLESFAKGKVVLLLPQPTNGVLRTTPIGTEMSDVELQVQVLHTLLSRSWIRQVSSGWQIILSCLLAISVAWLLLSFKGWPGLAGGFGIVLGYGVLASFALVAGGWVLPLVIPISAMAAVFGSTTLWEHLLASRKVLVLEEDMFQVQQELLAVREALICRENALDALEEDLEAARETVVQSTGREAELAKTAEELRARIADAQGQELAARQRIQALDRELGALRAAASGAAPLKDAEQDALRRECAQFGLITRDPQMLSLFRDLKKGARSSVTVLITGEPGTGKELLARAAHRLSARSAKPFVAVNMAAISPELFESELFGHVRGSFTGALNDRRGFFELAHQGTIFLDEIGDLRLDHQSKLLRVLQGGTFYRVGATAETAVDVRVLAATNKDLQRGVSEGWFREDLYFRLKGLVLHVPPLRERRGDIPGLTDELQRQAAEHLHRPPVALSQEALSTLQAHDWRGNVRELRQCLEQAVALSDGQTIATADLRLARPITSTIEAHRSLDAASPDSAGDAAVLQALRQHGFEMQATARSLGWDRSTVTQRLKGLCFQALVETGGDHAKAALALAGDPALLRTAELKLLDYYGHLVKTIQSCRTPEEAILDCRRRFKNLPERHFRSVEILIRNYFTHSAPASEPTEISPRA